MYSYTAIENVLLCQSRTWKYDKNVKCRSGWESGMASDSVRWIKRDKIVKLPRDTRILCTSGASSSSSSPLAGLLVASRWFRIDPLTGRQLIIRAPANAGLCKNSFERYYGPAYYSTISYDCIVQYTYTLYTFLQSRKCFDRKSHEWAEVPVHCHRERVRSFGLIVQEYIYCVSVNFSKVLPVVKV